jgi:hypothetical protein
MANTIPQTQWDDTGQWDGGSDYWDGFISSTEIAEMVTMLKTFHARNAQLQGLFLVHDDTAFDPTGGGAGYPNGTWQNMIDPMTGAFNRRAGVTYSYER